MVACDNESCSIEWFHFVCVGVTSKPKGEWFCPSCRGDSESVMRSPVQAENQVEIQVKSKVETVVCSRHVGVELSCVCLLPF